MPREGHQIHPTHPSEMESTVTSLQKMSGFCLSSIAGAIYLFIQQKLNTSHIRYPKPDNIIKMNVSMCSTKLFSSWEWWPAIPQTALFILSALPWADTQNSENLDYSFHILHDCSSSIRHSLKIKAPGTFGSCHKITILN